MAHRNARLTLHGRRLLIQRVVSDRRPVAHVVQELGVSRATGYWHQALTELGAQPRFTRRYRPQTNGKAERFNRTMCDEWIYPRPFISGRDRADALPGWLHEYNYHRAHTALGGLPPITRLTNVPEQHT